MVVYSIQRRIALWLVLLVLVFIATTHIIMDRRDIIKWWMRIAGVTAEFAWLSIVADQVFHILSLAVVAQFLVLASR